MMRTFTLQLFGLVVISVLGTCAFAQSTSREEALRQIAVKRAELQKLEPQVLAPSAEDLTAYAEFLRQADTGLIRLLPREIYDGYAAKNAKTALTLPGGGAYYSFVLHTHDYGQGSDIELEQGNLSVGFAGADYGMLLNVGDLALEEVTLERFAAHLMVTHDAATDEPQARVQQHLVAYGTTVDGITYKNRQPAVVGATYLLRSISYGRSDVLVAFRVVRKDTDGSLIITWKLLKKYPKPELARSN
jgi:hypothetical protein